MQKWCPEPLVSDEEAALRHAGAATPSVRAEALDERELERRRLFQPDGEAAGADALLESLTQKEREQLFDLVEADVTAAFERQAGARAQEQIAKLQQLMANLTEEIRDETRRTLTALARESVALAVQMAEKIVRARVDVDGDVLVRALETVLYKLEGTQSMTVTLNPEDAAVLEARPDLLAGLRIESVKADRRISRGGCRIACGRREWDATLESQLAAMGEIVHEVLESGDAPGGEGGDEPPVE